MTILDALLFLMLSAVGVVVTMILLEIKHLSKAQAPRPPSPSPAFRKRPAERHKPKVRDDNAAFLAEQDEKN